MTCGRGCLRQIDKYQTRRRTLTYYDVISSMYHNQRDILATDGFGGYLGPLYIIKIIRWLQDYKVQFDLVLESK